MPRNFATMAKQSKTTHVNKKHVAHLQKVRRQSRIIRYIAIGIFVAVGAMLVAGIVSSAGFPPYQYVARVNGEGIAKNLFVARAKMQKMQLANQKSQYDSFAQAFGVDPATDPNFSSAYNQITTLLSDDQQLGDQVLTDLENEVLIRQEAENRGITVSDAEGEEAMQQAFSFYPDGTPTAEPTATAMLEPTLNATQLALVTITPTSTPFATPTIDLSATPTATETATATSTAGPSATATPTETPYTQEGYEQQLKDTRDNFATQAGLTEDQFRKLFVANVLRQKLYDAINADAKPVQEQVWAQHILVETEEQAKDVLKRLDAGEDWSKLAAEVSIDTSNKDNGGDLGWFGRGVMVSEFEEAAFKAKAGETIGPVQTQFGYHIIRILGHEDRPLTDEAFQQAKDDAFSKWLDDARTAAKIKTYDFYKNLTFPIGQTGSQ
jgi:peptidyl-prolyl cis-trans isomerase D